MTSEFSSVRMVYFLMAMVLLFGAMIESWEIIVFVIVMLLVGFFTKFCPSKWLFEKLGFRKVDL